MINLQNPVLPDLNNYCNTWCNTELYIAIRHQKLKNRQTKLLKTTIRINFILVSLFGFLLYHMLTFIRYIEVCLTIRILDCVSCNYNEDFVKWRLVKSRFCSIHFTVIFAGVKKSFRYVEVR